MTASALAVAVALGACSEAETQQATERVPMSSTAGAYLAGRHAAETKEARAASDYFALALRHDPDNLLLMLRAFQANVRAGRVEAAAEIGDKLVKRKASNAYVDLVLIAERARVREFKDVLAGADKLDSGMGKALVAPVLRAWSTFAIEKDPAKAVAAMASLQVEPRYLTFFELHSALIYDLAGNKAEAEKLFGALYKRQTLPSLRVAQTVASFYSRIGKKAEAVKALDGYLETNPDSSAILRLRDRIRAGDRLPEIVSNARDGIGELYLNVGSALQQSNRSDQALFFAQIAVYLRPKDATTLYMLGSVLEEDDQHAAATEAFDRVPKSSVFSWTARKSAVANLVELKRYDEAVKALTAMAEERKDRWDALALLGNLHRSRSHFDKAVTAYDQAFARIKKVEKRHWSLLYWRGIALEREQNWVRAEADFLKALELNPDHPYVLNYLAYSWVDRGLNLKRAQEMLAKAVRQRPRDGYIVDSVGWAAYRLGDFQAAVKSLERATELRPHDPIINDHLGDAYWRAGRHHEARIQWRRALSLKPEEKDAPRIKKKLADGMEPFQPIVPKK